MQKRTLAIILFLILISPFLWIKRNLEFVINTSPSIHQKYLVVLKGSNEVKKGDLIVFPFKGSDIAPKGLRFIKRVVCGPGDFLEVKGRNFYCNGKFLGRALEYTCKIHKKVDAFHFRGIIPEGKYFVMGENRCSYDSRYWGFVDKKDIEGKVLWAFGEVESENSP